MTVSWPDLGLYRSDVRYRKGSRNRDGSACSKHGLTQGSKVNNAEELQSVIIVRPALGVASPASTRSVNRLVPERSPTSL